MKGHPEVSHPPEVARNRCRCGHPPTTHMKVVPLAEGFDRGYRLDPVGPCAWCGEAVCRRYTPGG